MPTNHYFDFYNYTPEQRLIEDLITESIRIHGINMYYLPRKASAQLDSVYGEDPNKYFDEAHLIEMYIRDVEGWGGERDVATRFGLEIREQITFQLSMRRFGDLLAEQTHLQEIRSRPQEGDLLYLRFNNPDTSNGPTRDVLEIQFAEHESIFHQLGALQVYDLTCETFRYSQEEFTTGIVDIDQAFANGYSQYVSTGNTMPDSATADNVTIEVEADAVLDFSEDSPFGDYT